MKRESGYMDLSGEWGFSATPMAGAETVVLPGTTDTNGKGRDNTEASVEHLTRPRVHTGPAWYRKTVDIPGEWAGKRIRLELERTKDSRVYVDGVYAGARDSLCTPHGYDLTGMLKPGRHEITVLVDNSNIPPVGDPHQLSEHTQTNWNGIVGRIGLVATPPVFVDSVRVFPDVAGKRVRVQVEVRNSTGKDAIGSVTLSAETANTPLNHAVPPMTVDFGVEQGQEVSVVEAMYGMGADPLLWDESNPALYDLRVGMEARFDGGAVADAVTERFGMREFTVNGTQFAVNGRTVFLRGKHDACVFPLTGYAPMDKAEWVRQMSIAKSYGINHYRFHTWCPPKAAFEAADEVGVYMQPELPNWASIHSQDHPDYSPGHHEYLMAEGLRILDAFGNHPSFVMFALGNELWGSRQTMASLVRAFREHDPRHLYAVGSNNFFHFPHLNEGDDYWTTMRTEEGCKIVRGSCAYSDVPLGHVQAAPPSTDTDYSDAIEGIPVPVIGHEIGQYQVFPDFREIPKYTGVLKPDNLIEFRERLRAKGMLDQADDFVRASGRLAVACYREDMEAALRTRGFGGFQLLDLQDFPGQGTALVGILDAFMDSKGLVEPDEWRMSCSELVPLLRLPKLSWTTGEVLEGTVELANFSPRSLEGVVATVSLLGPMGEEAASATLPAMDAPQGTLTGLGGIRLPLGAIKGPEALTAEIRIAGSGVIAVNRYRIWVFPESIGTTPGDGIAIRDRFDAETIAELEAGGTVLLLPPLEGLEAKGQCVGGSFAPDFWCYPMFRKDCENKGKPVSPGTLGILCDPAHPALAGFPTEGHSDWQWWPITMHSRPMIMDGAPDGFRPIVQVIDNFERNHRLGLVFETRVGRGRLLVCGSDLAGNADKPEVGQFLHSLLRYMGSPAFEPRFELDMALLVGILPG